MENKINLDKILPLVQRPARYINRELNSTRKIKDSQITVCFCFPDLYEVGASNLGLEILYHLVNENENAIAERCYAPAPDMENILRQEKIPLFSLESQAPLGEFDIIGFSLQYELCATNVLNMLDLAGLPVFSAQREKMFPIVIGGGPVTSNPEPLADFFDAFVLGEGEEAVGEIIETVAKFKALLKQDENRTKKDLLLSLSAIPGVYVPSMYSVEYNSGGTISSIKPVSEKVPEKIEKRTVKLEEAFFPQKKIVPYIQTIHDRLNVEIARGCPSGCRFCQAEKYYRPWRMRSQEKILALVENGLASTGYEEVSFSSLSCTQYKGLGELLSKFNNIYGSKRINISLPSIRCSQFSVRVAKNLGCGKRASLTFAPEAGTERLRCAIGKDLSDKEIRDTLLLASSLGWRVIKLYFMIGLPTETETDIDGIIELVRSVKRQARNLDFNVTVSPFVPKAQTPFQWAAMAKPEVVKSRMQKLSKTLPATVKGHFIENSLLEGVFARGDRRLSKVVFKAWHKGCKFDQWKEQCRHDFWQEAFKETGVNPEFYLFRERTEEEILPWEHLLFGVSKKALWLDYQRSFEPFVKEQEEIPQKNQVLPPAILSQGRENIKSTAKLRLCFARKGMLRFLSHLEQIELFRRAMRRVGIPLSFTSGFSPQPRMSFGPAISVGYESRSEYVEIELYRSVELEAVRSKIRDVLPEGYELLSAKKIPLFFPSLDSLVNVADYEIKVEVSEKQMASFLERKEIIVEKRKENRIEKIDAKPLIRRIKNEGGTLFLQMRFGPKRSVKPEKIVQLLCGMQDNEAKLVPISRTGLLIEKADGSLSEP